jgi:N-acetylmuramoyl-L-alanine amidase
MKAIERIIIHCSASPNGDALFRGEHGDANFQTPVERIDEWHAARGFKRDPVFRARQNPKLKAIGYHFVIYLSGVVVTGRHEQEMGASVAGWNDGSLAICMIGTDRFSMEQWKSLEALLFGTSDGKGRSLPGLIQKHSVPTKRICGHRDLSPDKNGDGKVTSNEWLKICPGFDVATWLREGARPAARNLWPGPDAKPTPDSNPTQKATP